MVLRHLSTNFLIKCSVYISMGGLTSAFVMRSILMDRQRKSEYFQSAMKILRQHEGAKSLLGEPIKETSFELGNPNYVDVDKAYFEVNVKGPKDKGILYFYARKISEEAHWDVFKVELELKSDSSRRLVIKKSDINQNSTDVVV